MAIGDTKAKILDVAEKLFAEHGIRATSIRQIVKNAGVNVASIHYHFGSKEAVIQEIITRRLQPFVEDKEARLTQLLESAGDQPPLLESVIRAFFEPHIQMRRTYGDNIRIIMKLMIQVEDDSTNFKMMNQDMAHMFHQYLSVLRNILPDLSEGELISRFKFMLGAMHAFMVQHELPADATIKKEDVSDEDLINHIVTFLIAGFRAPATK